MCDLRRTIYEALDTLEVFSELHHSLFFIPHSSLKNQLLPWGITIYEALDRLEVFPKLHHSLLFIPHS